jgi:small GTP-binding protein
MIEQYKEAKENITTLLKALAGQAGTLGMQSLKTDIIAVRLPKLADERFNLVVLGEFNHGKSTFVNAMIGEAILPVGITPTTATINHIVWSKEPSARAVLRDGTTQAVDTSEIAEYVTMEGEHSEGIRYLELGYPAEILQDRITLVDTPGVNDISEARAEITYSYIPRADAVIFLLDSTQVLKRSERIFIQQRLLRRSRDKLLFVLGKNDLLDPDEQKETLAFAKENLGALIDDPVIFSLSARSYLEENQKDGGMSAFLAYLTKYLTEQRGRVLLDNAISDGLRTCQYIQSSVGIKRGSLQLSLEELSQRIDEIHKQLEGSKQNLNQLVKRVGSECDAIKATLRHDLRLFVEAFCEALPAEIEKADASDVKRYLHNFIQDKFKEWAELEGDKLAELLEHLAEEIIKVTNENVHSVLDAVSTGLGAEDTRVDLEVDTLHYDAGVFALGALGTTVFLFVNTFVGGLLTLAAPILAVVLREKVGAKIKEQAKIKAPEAIHHAAETIQPRFEEIVDQFASRLTEFVTNAGEALTRGISEVLDKSLSERGERQQDAAVLSQTLDAQQAAVTEIEKSLEQLRGTIWVTASEPASSVSAEPKE